MQKRILRILLLTHCHRKLLKPANRLQTKTPPTWLLLRTPSLKPSLRRPRSIHIHSRRSCIPLTRMATSLGAVLAALLIHLSDCESPCAMYRICRFVIETAQGWEYIEHKDERRRDRSRGENDICSSKILRCSFSWPSHQKPLFLERIHFR